MTIDLVYFEGCPHVDAARAALREAVAACGENRGWREWRSDDPDLPAYARGFGSPSIFVAGREVTGAAPGPSSLACRVYPDRGAPALASIVAALKGES